MANNPRIFNQTRKCWLKHQQALNAIEAGACKWAVYGETIENCTIAESIAFRNKSAAEREPLACAELPGLIYQPPASDKYSWTERAQMLKDAGQFVSEAIQ